MDYVMESKRETDRLIAQEQMYGVGSVFDAVGLQRGMSAADIGCGPGLITREIAERVGDGGRVVGVDLSPQRVEEARRQNGRYPFVELKQGSVMDLPLSEGSFDLVWSQYLFQYLPDPKSALEQLRRICRPGGKVVVSDIDGMGLIHWPISGALAQAAQRFMDTLGKTGFDPYVGRKLYSLFQRAGFREIRVHLRSQYSIAGAATEAQLEDWRIRFDALKPVGVMAFGNAETYQDFCQQYLTMLSDEAVFSYAPLLVTEGIR